VDHHKRLAAAGEEIGRSYVRLRLANDDLRQELASKDELIRQLKESHEAELQKVREEVAVLVSREVIEECKAKIDIDIETVEEARQKDKDRLEQLKTRFKGARRLMKELREELDSLRQKEVSLKGRIGVLSAEKEKMRDEKEIFANKAISLQARLDQMEDFKDTIYQMLKDIYYRVWGTCGLAWMSDYPQVIARIHKQILDILTVKGRLSGGPSTDRLLVDSHFTVEELEVIQKGYELLAEEEAEEEVKDQTLAGLDGEAMTGPQGAGRDNLLSMSYTSISISYSVLADNLVSYA